MQLLCNSAPDVAVAKDEKLAARRMALVGDICRNANGAENDRDAIWVCSKPGSAWFLL